MTHIRTGPWRTPLNETAELHERTQKRPAGATNNPTVIFRRIRIDDRLAPAVWTGKFFRHHRASSITLVGNSVLRSRADRAPQGSTGESGDRSIAWHHTGLGVKG
jgi:hypothetical protein